MKLRIVKQNILEAMSDSPVVLLNGARQTGKSTLVLSLSPDIQYLTLDDPVVLTAAKQDAFGFINSLEGSACIDEVQRAPELFLAIKAAVDKDRTLGRFLLTGSANVLMLPQMADSLAGRMEIIELWPLAQAEINQKQTSLIDKLFAGDFASNYSHNHLEFIDILVGGGYPEVLTRKTSRRQEAWFENYLITLLQRDVKDLAQIEGLTELPKLLELLAVRSGGLLNFAELSRSSKIPQTTLKRYMALLETLFLIRLVPAWSSNLGKRLQKSPKLFLSDYGLMAYLQGLSKETILKNLSLPGELVESFVHSELAKHQSWASFSTRLMHYRTTTGVEVDFVLENRQKELVAIEVKSKATLTQKDLRGLKHLRETTPQTFKKGIVFYTGETVINFDETLMALPIAFLLAK